MDTCTSSGSNVTKFSDRVHVFLSPLESCTHIGEKIECLTLIEFECIIDIKESNDSDDEDDLQKR